MMPLDCKLALMRSAMPPLDGVQIDGRSIVVLFFSFADGLRRATVRTAAAETLDAAWALGSRLVAETIADCPSMASWLRVDWVDAVSAASWGELATQMPSVKRNYFRLGISLDSGFAQAFLETEINANAMLYMGAIQAGAGVNQNNFARYARLRHRLETVDFTPDREIWLFTTRALFSGEDGVIHPIDGAGLHAGVREQGDFGPDHVLGMINAGSRYLASQVGENGRFHYGWHPCFNRSIETYNSLRHASSLFAMIEAWDVTRDDDLRAAIDRGIGYLLDSCVKYTRLKDGREAAWLIDEGNEIKLGGMAACILALTQYEQVFGIDRHATVLDALGTAILSMQDPLTGRFDHVLSFPAMQLKERFRVVYYDGEAVFALLRLYRGASDERWLNAAAAAMDYFIEVERWREHDHWLAYCVDEMTRVRPLERYFVLGLRNIGDYLDFIRDRITAFPTLLELCCATDRVICRLANNAACHHLLESFDISRFQEAMHQRARYLANSHFWPELAMFFARPGRIVGSFFIRHHAFRVRIDDVEHFLSGLIAYRAIRPNKKRPTEKEKMENPHPVAEHWSISNVAQATRGTWIRQPPEDWSSNGLSIYAPSFRPGDMIVARCDGKFGISTPQQAALGHDPAAMIVDNTALQDGDIPVLHVPDLPQAVLDLGHFARRRFTGSVIGVTGSAGKTSTVAMLSHALRQWGEVGQTRFNANLPPGIAWNLASIPWSTPHIVLEMAIGRMRQNAQLARPDIALFTNILPAHLEYHHNTQTIAERKSRIFEGMRSGGVAILNREMLHWDQVQLAARDSGLKVINYGDADDADIQLVSYDAASSRVSARVAGRTIGYTLGAPGHHMALNSLAVLGVAVALGHNVTDMLPRLATFTPLTGRGDLHVLDMGGRRLTVLNDAYNANPGSMAAALALFGTMNNGKRKVAVLGEMLELGEHAARYHTELAPLIAQNDVDRVHVVGDLYRQCWDSISEQRRGIFAQSLEQLKSGLKDEFCDGDLVMIKGSHGSGVHTLLEWIARKES
jgi:UDP-N-acetylmuramoyl-tripeptide--D-alanyl-D-alanine ligase